MTPESCIALFIGFLVGVSVMWGFYRDAVKANQQMQKTLDQCKACRQEPPAPTTGRRKSRTMWGD